MAWLQGWGFRKPIQINNIGINLSDYQTPIKLETASLILSAKMQSGGQDIRFTDSDGSTPLNYWIETGINTASTLIWVKIPSISTGQKTIYFYYGNPTANSMSDGLGTFIFFDDFSINTWFGDDTFLHVQNNRVNFHSNMNGAVNAFKYKSFSKTSDLVVYFTARVNPGQFRGGIGVGFGDSAGRFIRIFTGTSTVLNSGFTRLTQDQWNSPGRTVNGTVGLGTGTGTNPGTQHWYKTAYQADNVALTVFNDSQRSSAAGGTTSISGVPTSGLNYLIIANTGEAFNGTSNNFPGDNSFMGPLFITKFTLNEPAYAVGPEESGSVSFISNPSGARIILDGMDTGVNTPSTLNVSITTHTYELRLECYEPATGDFMAQSGTTVVIDRTLRKNTGDIFFNTNPAGANIWIDGIVQNPVTPSTLSCILEGPHNYILTLSGYQYFRGPVTVTANQTIGIDVTLVPLQPPGFGSLYINSIPTGAAILIDGIDSGLITPNTIQSISVGTHSLKLTKYGYQDYTDTVTIEENVTSILEANLIAITGRGSINFSTTPLGATIFLDGIDQGTVTPIVLTDIPIGTHSYLLRLSGYNDYTGSIEVLQNQTVNITANLIPAEGCIYFNTSPVGAKIFIDDIDTGQITPYLICNITLGTHTYRLELVGYELITDNITLLSGNGQIIARTLQPEVQLTAIEILPSSISINKGDTQQFVPICKDQFNDTMACPIITWESTNPNIGTISNTGLFTGLSEGTTIIRTISGTIIGTATVSVEEPIIIGDITDAINVLARNITYASLILGAAIIGSVIIRRDNEKE